MQDLKVAQAVAMPSMWTADQNVLRDARADCGVLSPINADYSPGPVPQARSKQARPLQGAGSIRRR